MSDEDQKGRRGPVGGRRGAFERMVLDELRGLRHEVRDLRREIRRGGGGGGGEVSQTMEEFMADIRAQVQDLVDKVRSQRTVIDSVNALMVGLKDSLANAQGQLDAAGEQSASDALAEVQAALQENASALATAVAEGTAAKDEEGGGRPE